MTSLGPRAGCSRPVAPSEAGSAVGKLLLLIVLGVGGYGGYYGYCRFKASETIHGFEAEANDQQRNWLSTKARDIGAEDIRQFVLETAARHGVVVRPESIQVSLEPYSATSAQKLPSVVRTGIDVARRAGSRYGGSPEDVWVVGFRAELEARQGPVRERFVSEHHTWFQQVKR